MFDDTWPAQVPHFSLALLVLVQGCAVLWGEQLLLHFCHQSLLPSLHRSCCSGFSMVFSSANQGFFSSSEMSRRWHLYSVLIIPFWLWQPLSCLSVLLSMSTSESFLTLLNIPRNTFPPLILFLEGAGFLPWGSLYIPFCLYQTSHPWIGYQKFVPQFHSFLLCVHCQLANVLLRSSIHCCLDLCQLLDEIVVFYLCWSLWKPLQMLQDRL